MVNEAPEIKPRYRPQAKQTLEMPFNGIVMETVLVPEKDGKKAHCLATVANDGGETMQVRYFPPLKTWSKGEKVRVQKGSYGPELKEIEEGETPF
jgi:hypothetical protein